MIRFNVGDLVMFKKKHPCGSFIFRVMRVGSDVRVICTGCNRDMTIEREKIEKIIKKVCNDTLAENG